jgi:hypothetical protein
MDSVRSKALVGGYRKTATRLLGGVIYMHNLCKYYSYGANSASTMFPMFSFLDL